MYLQRFLFCLLCVYLTMGRYAGASENPIPRYKKLYQYAEKLSHLSTPTDKTDELALKNYKEAIKLLEKYKNDIPFLLKSYISTGAFLQTLNRSNESIIYFRKAFRLKQITAGLPDSVMFKPLVYCGNAYYRQDRPDSADYLYNQARTIAEKYPGIAEVERLYNTLGVVAYNTGNYNKSVTFYQKALNTLLAKKNVDNSLLVAYKSNLASAYRKQKRYSEALTLYKETLPYNFETDKLYHNIGAVYLAMGKYKEAIIWLNKVKYQDQKKLNDLAKAALGEKNYANALSYLHQAAETNKLLNHSRKNSDNAITLQYQGDAYLQQNQSAKALGYYQQALCNFLPEFKPADIYLNPASFSSAFNGVETLETLLDKAKAFEQLYASGKRLRDLEAALQTYSTFYRLADYIQQFYETDESRMLITDRKYASREQPIAICLQLYALTHKQDYVKQALVLDEENKANTLRIGLEQARLKAISHIPAALLQQERALKDKITGTALLAAAETDSIKLITFKRTINDNAVKLIAVQDKINRLIPGNGKNAGRRNIDIANLQNKIPGESAILSYHLTKNNLLCFIITNNKFDFFNQPIDTAFYYSLKKIYKQAQQLNGNVNRLISQDCKDLYRQLVKPAEHIISNKTDLMIIADGELNYLPFELLINSSGNKLADGYSITYNYSCTTLQNSEETAGHYNTKLGMAPFSEYSGSDAWRQLPLSGKEISALDGTLRFDRSATKEAFLNSAPHYDVIHLATHAYANDKDPDKSFIAFYPAKPDSDLSYKVYLPEIYNLKLDKTQLVVISACEAGTGELINGEGLMSLSRAFSYAGCNNIITTMWKADDASTAYISIKFHHYLQQGYGIGKALQQARKDYLDDPSIDQVKKQPGYWAHLRVIGGFHHQENNNTVLFIAIGVVVIFGMLALKNRGLLKAARSKKIN